MANATWLADVLRKAGVPVIEESGWQSRAQSGSFSPRGLIRHWDASSPSSHGAVEYMRDNIACNITTCRGNSSHGPSVHVLAAGRAWHAGEGSFGVFPTDQGNTYAIGHEVAHTVDEAWTEPQYSVVVAAEQAILAHLSADVDQAWCTHSEYAPSRKIDTTGGEYGQDPAHERLILRSGVTPAPTPLETDMLLMSTPDGRLWITDGMRKRHIRTPQEQHRYQDNGVAYAGVWNSVDVDALPTDPGEYAPPPPAQVQAAMAGSALALAVIALVLAIIIAIRLL